METINLQSVKIALNRDEMEEMVGGSATGGGGKRPVNCTKESTAILLGLGSLAFAAATGGLGAIAIAGFGFYLSVDSAANGSCSSW
jgi:hypothetical protein